MLGPNENPYSALGSICSDVILDFLQFHCAAQPQQSGGLRRGIATNPAFVNLLDRHGIKMIPPFAPFAHRNHQSGTFKHTKVLHDSAPV